MKLSLKIDKLDIDKLAPVPVDLSKLSDLVKNDDLKKTVYDKLVAKVSKLILVHSFKKLIMIQIN